MGNASSAQGPGGATHEAAKTCYYELLSVDRAATQEEIKKAYRRKALELHPDRNYGDVERATKLFAEVQAAYEVLSDPQERAWYDSHREAILHGGDGHGPDGTTRYTSTTTTEDIYSWLSLFPSKSVIDYSDGPNGFYTSLRQLFDKLAKEEMDACQELGIDAPYFPGFGNSRSGYDEHVKHFYTHWTGFRTSKTFAWMDLYRLSDAPDRRIRRVMEKENRKSREDALQEFNDTVRQFVQFARKRDPRYTPPYAGLSEAQRHAAILQASKIQSAKARARAQNASKNNEYKPAEWTQPAEPFRGDQIDEFPESGEDNKEVILHECVACRKNFKSEAQFSAHEKSNKHKKAVSQLQKMMMKEDKELGLGKEEKDPKNIEIAEEPAEARLENNTPQLTQSEQGDEYFFDAEEEINENLRFSMGHPESLSQHHESPDSTDDSDSIWEEEQEEIDSEEQNELQSQVSGKFDDSSEYHSAFVANMSRASHNNNYSSTSVPKIGKAKLKRQKKVVTAAVSEASGTSEHKCASCHQPFLSRQKLFNHLKEFPNHAAPIPMPQSQKVPEGRGTNQKKGKR